MKPILIVDYGMANLRSVQKAFEKVGHAADHQRRSEPRRRGRQTGAARRRRFPRRHRPAARSRSRRADRRAHQRGQAVSRHLPGPATAVHDQLRGRRSSRPRSISRRGRALRRTSRALKVPHMGWNQLHIRRPAPLFRDLPPDAAVYFVHSYYVSRGRGHHRHGDRLSDAVHVGDLARERVRHAVSSGEEPEDRAGDATATSRHSERLSRAA